MSTIQCLRPFAAISGACIAQRCQHEAGRLHTTASLCTKVHGMSVDTLSGIHHIANRRMPYVLHFMQSSHQ